MAPQEGQETISRAKQKGRAGLCGDSLVSIMISSHKQHVGLLPDDVFRGPKLSKSLSYVLRLSSQSTPLKLPHRCVGLMTKSSH